MSFDWHFFTGGYSVNPTFKRCHRGPMIEVEQVMAQKWGSFVQYDHLRVSLLDNIVDTDLIAVRTREVLLRSINGMIGPVFARTFPQKKSLQVTICEKRNSVLVDAAINYKDPYYRDAIRDLAKHRVPQQQRELLLASLESNSPIIRVSGRCAIVLLYSYIQMDINNG